MSTSINMLNEIIESGTKLTPMMEQYYEIKKNYIDHIVLFRMGDFYEVFFEDAIESSKILNITLTHRGKLGEFKIPMAGIPHHAAPAYVDRITNHGIKVAIAEQVQSPKEAKEAKSIVKRAVTQVVSPGLPYDLEKTQANERHYLASGFEKDGNYFLVAIDFTTGEFLGHKYDTFEDFIEQLRLYSPKEFITFMGQWEDNKTLETLINQTGILRTYLSSEYFTTKYTEIYIEKIIPAYKRDKVIKQEAEVLCPIGALSYYICSTQQADSYFHIKPFRMINADGFMKVTLPTLTGLEILPKSRETYKDSLLGFLDKTQTSLGSRFLKNIFLNPLTNLDKIEQRQSIIDYLLGNTELLNRIREELCEVRDLERILAKTATGKATPGDIISISRAAFIYNGLKNDLKKLQSSELESFSKSEFSTLIELSTEIKKTINDEIGASLDKGNLIMPGQNTKRDRLAKLSQNASGELTRLEQKYREETGIPKLRVKSNNVAGYFIEISKVHTDKVPKSFDRKQTLVNSERYVTPELAEFEKEMISAKDKLERLEREIFKGIITKIAQQSALVQKLANIISALDVFQSFTWITLQEDFSKPIIKKNEKIVQLRNSWHPLIKSIIKDQFVPHNLTLDKNKFFGLITGPNMAGKTTVMREVAIVQLLAQVGCYVPAYEATIGVCDYLFSRLGASDDILKGQSTFMVEMAETAEIIRHATDRSLIILDEVGRGTSTYDGLSIAWALVEHFISRTKAITLFATHYHELIDLVNRSPEGKNLTVETQSKNGDVHFLYNLIEQGASQSFGIYVAKLAGLPPSILKRSGEILQGLEASGQEVKVSKSSLEVNEPADKKNTTQLSFFESVDEPKVPEYLQKIEENLSELDVMNMTPIQAMQKLQDLKEQLH